MIRVKDYTTIMSEKLEEAKVGNFGIIKRFVPKGKMLRTYNPKLGRFYHDVFDKDFPIVILHQEGKGIWMSDTPQEQESLHNPVRLARGDVLICGLGIGLLPTLIADKRSVQKIDIVELSEEVIELVFPRIETPKMRIIKEDAFKFFRKTGNRYDFIYVDIWDGIIQPIKEIEKIRKLAKPCLKPDGVVFCWLEELYERVKDALPNHPMRATGEPGIHPPCLICEKVLRGDYAGLCMDCADTLGISELFLKR